MTMLRRFPGTDAEQDRFLRALANNCECEYAEDVLLRECNLHTRLAGDSSWPDRVVYAMRLKEKLRYEEFVLER